MPVADSPKKKRRASSLMPTRRKTAPRAKAVEVQPDDMEASMAEARAMFDAAVEDSQALKTYNRQHDELLAKEYKTSWDRDARADPKSDLPEDINERKADAIIRAIREYERRVTFGNLPSEAIPGPETLDMGGQFLTNKDRIEQKSLLYKIAQFVPKGALLHLHFNAELYPERLLKEARRMPNMYIRSIQPLLTTADLDVTEVVFNVMDEDQVEKGVDIFSPTYPGTATNWKQPDWKFRVWMKWRDFQQAFDERFGAEYEGPGYSEFSDRPETPEDHTCGSEVRVKLNRTEKWLYSKMVLSPEEAYGPSQTVNGYVSHLDRR
jgi:adenosine deaminase CECR1